MDKEVVKVNQQIAKVEVEIEQVERDIAAAEEERKKGGPREEFWLKEKEDLRYKERQLREKEALLLRASLAALTPIGHPSPSTSGLRKSNVSGAALPALPAIQLQLPEDLAAFLQRAVKKEINVDFPDEISVGGSKMDINEAKEVLVRMGFERVQTVIGKTDAAHAESSNVFEWKSGVREDDSVNMTNAESFVQKGLAKYIEGFTVVNICQRNIFNKFDATPTKRIKLRDTKTDLAVVMSEFAERAKENPRNVLDQTCGIIDAKTKEAWKRSHEEFWGQALGQFIGCTLISGRKGVGMPVMLSNLVGDSHIFHGMEQPDGGAIVREVVFTSQEGAIRYFGEVCKKAEVAPRRNLADLLAEVNDIQPHLPPAARLESPPTNRLRTPHESVPPCSPADNDLTECIYRELQREHPLLNLPPFELMMEYWGNLEQGLSRAAEVRSLPSYIS